MIVRPCRCHKQREERCEEYENIAQKPGAPRKKTKSTTCSVRVTQQIRTNGPTLGGEREEDDEELCDLRIGGEVM